MVLLPLKKIYLPISENKIIPTWELKFNYKYSIATVYLSDAEGDIYFSLDLDYDTDDVELYKPKPSTTTTTTRLPSTIDKSSKEPISKYIKST